MPDSSNSDEGSDSEGLPNQSGYSVGCAPILLPTYDAETLQEKRELQTMFEDLKKLPEGYIVAPELSKARVTELAKSLLEIYEEAGDRYQFDTVITEAYNQQPETLLSMGDAWAERPCYTHAWVDPNAAETVDASEPGSLNGKKDIGPGDSLIMELAGKLRLDAESETQPEQSSSAAHTSA
jgi:hypothetical protein